MIEKLQYITQETEKISHIDCVREACIAGVKWVQLRIKDKTEEEYLKIAFEAKLICDLYDAKLVINDNVTVAKEVNAYGVHLGKNDMDPQEARKILGKEQIIGGTANTVEDIQKLISKEVNYIGIGPYKPTKTKKNLSPLLGVEGYYEISRLLFNLLKESKLDNNIPPLIAIGGIELEDISELMKTGVHGIAVSSLLTKDFTKTETVIQLIEQPKVISFVEE